MWSCFIIRQLYRNGHRRERFSIQNVSLNGRMSTSHRTSKETSFMIWRIYLVCFLQASSSSILFQNPALSPSMIKNTSSNQPLLLTFLQGDYAGGSCVSGLGLDLVPAVSFGFKISCNIIVEWYCVIDIPSFANIFPAPTNHLHAWLHRHRTS